MSSGDRTPRPCPVEGCDDLETYEEAMAGHLMLIHDMDRSEAEAKAKEVYSDR